MGPEAKKEYAEAVREAYGRMNRQGKKTILNEFCRVTGYHRKSAIRVLNGLKREAKKKSGPEAVYGEEEVQVLKAIWLGMEQACGKRLVEGIGLWLPSHEKRKKLKKRVRENLLRMSAATADRLLKPYRAKVKGRLRCVTKPGSLLKTQIPIRGESWNEKRAGYMEADTVAHCGSSLAGEFVWSLTFTDIATGWTENRGVWNKGMAGVVEQMEGMEKMLPFKLLGCDCDNGSEFLNHHLWRHLRERKAPVEFTRSRPYRKNDQAHVEQKNWTHVRQLLGYERLGKMELVEPVNELYRLWGLFRNYFCPTLKLKSKVRDGSKIRKSYEKPRTPCQRVLECAEVDAATKARLRRQMKELDPFDLTEQIEVQLRRVFDLNRRLDEVQKSTIQVNAKLQPDKVTLGNIFP